MKSIKYYIIICLLLILSVSCNKRHKQSTKLLASTRVPVTKPVNSNNNNTNAHKYSIKSGIVTFTSIIAGNTGKKILYFDDYGLKEREDFYDDNKLRESVLTDGKTLYKVRYADKIAFNMGDAQRGTAYKVDWNEIPDSQKKDGYAIKQDNMNIAGKVCECYKVDNAGIITTFAGWDGICLFSQQQSKLGNAETKAVTFEENASIPADKFKLPKGIRVK